MGNSVWGHQKGHGYLCTDTFFLHNRFIFKVSDKNLGNSERAIETFVTILHFHWIQWVMQHFLLSILFPCKIRIGLQDIAVKLNVWCQIIYSREGNLKKGHGLSKHWFYISRSEFHIQSVWFLPPSIAPIFIYYYLIVRTKCYWTHSMLRNALLRLMVPW